MFSSDYDGYVVGAAANAWSHMNAQFIWVRVQAVHKDIASEVPLGKISADSRGFSSTSRQHLRT